MEPRDVPFLRAVARSACLAAVVGVPLLFATFTDQVFEPEKAALVRFLALVAAAAAGAALALGSGRRPVPADLLRRPVVAAVAGLWVVEALSTALSVSVPTSVMGSVARGQGLVTTSALVALFLAAASLARSEGGPRRLGDLIGLAAFPAGLYGAAQRFGLDPLPWAGDVVTRVAGPAGNSVMLGAALAVALPFTSLAATRAWREASAGGQAAAFRLAAWLLVVAAGTAGLVLSGSRGPAAGLAVGLATAGLALAARRGRRRLAVGVAATLAVAIAGVVVLNQPGGPLAPLARLPLADRLATALDPARSTTRVRLRLWEGTVAALARDPARLVAGYGPETMDLVWAPSYPPILAYDEPRGYVPDRAHALALDALLTGGLLGLGAILALFTALLDRSLAALGLLADQAARRAWLGSWVGGGAVGVAAARLADGGWRLAGTGLGLGLVAGLVGWLATRGNPDRGEACLAPTATSARDADLAAASVPAPGSAVGPGFAVAALAAIVAHLVELQVGFAVTTTRLVVFVVAGALAAAAEGGARHEATERAREPARTPQDGLFVALVVGTTLAFDFARGGLVAGGGAAVAVIVALSVLVGALAIGIDQPAVLAKAGLGIAAFAAVQAALLRLGSDGAADALAGVGLTVGWYGLVLVALVLWRAGLAAGGWPSRRAAVAGAAALAVALVVAWPLALAPVMADAAAKEGRLGWEAQVAPLRAGAESGKAESFLDRAQDRYALATRLAPWAPTYQLALAREEVVRGDLLDERLERALLAAGEEAAAEPFDPSVLDGGAVELVARRDGAFARAVAESRVAEGLAPGSPGPVLTRARAERVWAERTRGSTLRTARLEAASASYAEAMALAPGWPEALDEAAATALLAGDGRAALDLARRALGLDPFYLPAERTAARAHAAAGDEAAAADAYGRYLADLRNTSDLGAWRGYLAALAAAGRDDEALEAARTITRLAPDDAHAQADLATLLARAGEAQAALDAARLAAELDPEDPAIRALVRRLTAERGGQPRP